MIKKLFLLGCFIASAGATEPQLFITIGPKGKAQLLQPFNGQAQTPELNWTFRFTPRNKMRLMHSTITNRTGREILIEPELRLVITDSVTGFWGGFNRTEPIGNRILARRGTKSTFEKNVGGSMMPFPVSAVFNRQQAYFLGSVPFAPLSYHAATFDPRTRMLGFSLRLVLPPHGKVEFSHTFGSVPAEYGAQEAVVQSYYESFPELWQPVNGQNNPYIWGHEASYSNWWNEPDSERTRRLFITLEWTYCPYRRSGDIYGHDDLSDYKPKNAWRKAPGLGGVPIAKDQMTNAQYRQLRADRYAEFGKRYGWMFYNSCNGVWCEAQLASSRYPDAINNDPDVPRVLNSWSTGHDEELRVFPMGTSFDKVFKDDSAKLVQELQLPGFALDCHYGGAFYRGPAVEKELPGRAWDEHGKFIDQAVALNQLADYLHTLQVDGKPVTLFVNGYLKGDYHMLEATYFIVGRFRRNMPLWRWHVGPKPGTTHGPFNFATLVPDWRNLTREQFLDIYTKLGDYILLSRFQYGLNISHVMMSGNPRLLYASREALELSRLGWQAETPMVTEPENLRISMRSRYGRGVQTVFFAANTSPEEIKGKLLFDNSYLTNQGTQLIYALKRRDQSELVNRLSKKFTQIDTVLPSRTPMLFEAVMEINAPDETICRVKADKYLHRQLYTLRLRGKEFRSSVKCRAIRGFHTPEIRLNGKKVAPETELNFPPNSKLEILYRSLDFKTAATELLKFPFANIEKPFGLTIQINTKASRNIAEKFNTYFDFCRKNGMISKKSLPVEIVSGSTPYPNIISLIIEPGESGITATAQQGIVIRAANQEQLENLVDRLFEVMDLQYPWSPPLASTIGFPQTIPQYFGLLGHRIAEQKYFGEVQ